MTMPEKIWVHDFDGETATAIKDNNSYATEYIRHDLYEALEAESKMLAAAVLKLAWNVGHYKFDTFFANTLKQHAEAIALAQRIGGK